MNNRKQRREIEKVIYRVMKTAGKFDQIGKSEFEIILNKIMQQVEKNTDADPEQLTELTPRILDDMPTEYGQLSEEASSMEGLIGYLYGKYLKELGLLEA